MRRIELSAGVARVDITPPLGFRMQGIMRRTEGAVGIESPLTATVLVLGDEVVKLVLVDCDLLGFDLPLAADIRRALADGVGTVAEQVLLGCTHTHNGPCTVCGILGAPTGAGAEEEGTALAAYITNLIGLLVGAARQADQGRVPARAAAGRGEAAAAVNREERNEDGRILVGRNPDGPVDHSVDVLRVDDLQGQPIAVLVGYAAHPVVMGMESYEYSPDYPGVVRRIVESATGATCLFFTGAAGNQATWSFLQRDWGEKERMGGLVGGEAVKVFYDIESRPHRVERRVDASLSGLALYQKEFEEGPTHSVLQAATRTVEVPLQALPSLAEAQEQLAAAEAALASLAGAPTIRTYPAQMVVDWARMVLDKIEAGIESESLYFEIVGYRLDDFALLGMPGEPFVEIGLAVKDRSRASHTMFAGYSNGVLAYWPTPETVAQGGMAVEASVKTYGISAPPVSETVEIIAGAFGELLADLGL